MHHTGEKSEAMAFRRTLGCLTGLECTLGGRLVENCIQTYNQQPDDEWYLVFYQVGYFLAKKESLGRGMVLVCFAFWKAHIGRS